MGEIGRLIRPAAVLALPTMLLAHAISPAIKTAGLAVGTFIDWVDLVAGISSHLLALTTSAMAIGLLLVVGRDTRVSLVSRVVLVAQTTVVLVLAVPASRFRLSSFACFFLGIITCSAAMAGAFEALKQARSRALGMVLGLIGLAGTARLVSAGLVAIPPATHATKLAPLASALATSSVVLHSMGLLVTLAWLASRKRTTVSVGTMAALALALFVSWAASSGAQPNAPTWMVFATRLQDQLTALPQSSFPRVVEGFVAVLGPVIAAAVLVSRGQMATVAGGVTLVLTAGTLVDVPGHALIMVLAALAATLAAHDEQGMWEALMGKRLGTMPPSAGPPVDRSAEKV